VSLSSSRRDAPQQSADTAGLYKAVGVNIGLTGKLSSAGNDQRVKGNNCLARAKQRSLSTFSSPFSRRGVDGLSGGAEARCCVSPFSERRGCGALLTVNRRDRRDSFAVPAKKVALLQAKAASLLEEMRGGGDAPLSAQP
jgi:hypothetical protein